MRCLGWKFYGAINTMTFKSDRSSTKCPGFVIVAWPWESGLEAFVLLPIIASLAHDETSAAEVHGRGPVFRCSTGFIVLCA